MSVTKTRGFLYWLARLLGDYQAVSSGSSKKMARRVGRRAAGRATGKTMPDLSWARFGVEIFLSKTAQHWNIPVTAPVFEGLTHHMKESKLGLIPGFAYRLQMYKECLYALFNWKKYLNKDVFSEDDFSIEL